MDIKEIVLKSKSQVKEIVEKSSTDSRNVIARYTAAIAVNFTDWMGKTLPWARHELARYALIDNLRCEAGQDHVGMLFSFARLCNAMPDGNHYAHTFSEVAAIRRLFADPLKAGLSGVVLCAVLENTSESFIPDLARRAKDLGCEDFTYTDLHGEADVEHSDAFLKAAEAEMTMGYRDSANLMSDAGVLAVMLMSRIYSF